MSSDNSIWRSGHRRGLRRLLLATVAALPLGTMPAAADCTQAGSSVSCAPPGNGGFAALPGEDRLDVTVQPGTLVQDNGLFAIGVNDRNTLRNDGTVAGADGTVAIVGGNRNTLINNGAVTAGNGSLGIRLNNRADVTNNGAITVRDGSIGIDVNNNGAVDNGGSISAGSSAIAIRSHNDGTITNRGTVTVGDFSTGIESRDNGQVTNSGAIATGDSSFGINARDANQIANNGTIAVGGFQAAGIQVRDNNTNVANNGSIVAGPSSPGIVGRDGNTIVNNGSIVTANDPSGSGAGVLVRNDNTVTNNGTIIAGDASGSPFGFGVGVGLGRRNTFINNGSVIAGAYGLSLAPAFSVPANRNTVTNNGTLDGRIFLFGTGAPNAGNMVTNSGLITITNAGTPFVFHQIDGSFTQTASGTLALRVSPDTLSGYDGLNVSGLNPADALQLGGALRAIVQPGLYQATQTYLGVVNWCSCGGGAPIAGSFSQVAASSPFFTAIATYNANSVDLTLNRLPFNAVPGMTANQQAIGNALEAGYGGPLSPDAVTLYTNLFAAPSLAALDQLSGQGVTGVQSVGFSAGAQFNGGMLQQALGGNAGVSVTPLGYAPAPRRDVPDAFAALDASAAVTPGRTRLWASAFGTTQTLAGEPAPGTAGQTQRMAGGMFGVDRQVTPGLLVGLAVGASDGSFATDLAANGRVTGGHIGGYAVASWDPLYLAAAASYAHLTVDTARVIAGIGPTETATARTHADLFAGRVELGWKHRIAGFGVTPFVAIEPAVLHQQSYTETSTVTATGAPGILGLSFAGRATSSLPAFVGVQVDTVTTLRNGTVLAPFARASWVHEFLNERAISASLLAIPAVSFTVNGTSPVRDAARLDAGARLAMAENLAVTLAATGEFSDRGRSYGATASLRASW